VSLEKNTFVIPLTCQDKGLMTTVDTLPRSVRVTVKGRAQEVSRVSEKDFAAYIDLSKYAVEGPQIIPVQLTVDDALLALDPLEIDLKPDTVSVTLETRLNAYVPVKPVVYGAPAFGYAQRDVSAAPSEVRISGPRSMVNAITAIETSGVSLDGVSSSFSQTAALQNKNPFIILDGPGEAEVSVRIAVVELSQAFTVQVRVDNVPPGLALNPDSEPPTVEIIVSGAQTVLANLQAQNFTAVVNCASVREPGQHALPLTVTLPSRVRLESQPANEVVLDFTETD
jgi:YbbR domain-containing protein